MAAITWPSTLPQMREFELIPMNNDVIVMSPFSRQEQVEPRAAWWEAVATWPDMTHDQRAALRAFLIGCRQSVLRVPVADYRQHMGGLSGGASAAEQANSGATGITITASGTSPRFKAGDMIGFGGAIKPRVHIVTADATGTFVTFWPPVRETVTAGSSITTRNQNELTLSMRLSPESARSIPLQAAPRGGMTAGSMVVRFVEALRENF